MSTKIYPLLSDKKSTHTSGLGGKHTICPKCGRKTFKNYLDFEGRPIADGQVGRCERINSCCYHLTPAEWFKAHTPLSPAAAPVSAGASAAPALQARDWTELHSRIDPEIVRASQKNLAGNPLARFLHSVFDPLMGPEAVNTTLRKYYLGSAKAFGGSAVFWQIDHRMKARTGKIIGYDPLTGKRRHDSTNWVHALLKKQYPNFALEQCLFGAHLLAPDRRTDPFALPGLEPPSRPGNILLVESEKEALIIDLCLRLTGITDWIVVASGGCSAFNPTPIEIHNPLSKYAPLRHRHLALLPDEGKLREWREKARVLTGFCQSVSCLSFFTKDFSWPPYDFPIADGDGYDDMLLAYLAAGKDITQLIFNFSRYQPVDLVS